MPNLVILVLQIAVVIAASRAIALLFQRMHQPKVIGEMFAGIMLGPSLLGWVAPHLSASLFIPSSLGFLSALSQVGVVVYMFLVGLALNHKVLREHGHTAVLTSHVSIIAPFVLGSSLALILYPRLSDDSVSFTGFALFMGAAMSITAFPVLARILTDRDMLGTKLGSLAIACAAVDDVSGWCILAYIVLVVRAHQRSSSPLWLTLGGLGVFLSLMLYVVRPLLRRFDTVYNRRGLLTENAIALMVVVVLVAAVATEYLGLHLLFGSFLAGAIMPKDKRFVRYILDKFETPTVVLLLPLYFAFTGLRTSVRLIKGPGMWLLCAAIVLVAIAGKLGGSMIAARAAGTKWRESAGLGILMNTRGLMELVILNIGLDVGVISPALFSMMVVMALVTTFMTTPLLERVYPMHLIREERTELSDEEIVACEPA
ncbi:MAG TPA: cation:proton antiporter [Terriglobia bacterium]|nr:cation:proton antiporter [Terriglobia bacterium]